MKRNNYRKVNEIRRLCVATCTILIINYYDTSLHNFERIDTQLQIKFE